MKISMNWLKKYVDVTVSDEELIRLIGARLVEIEGVIDETHKYDNIYVVRVASCEKIPDTHLTLCQIDVGDTEVNKVKKDDNGLVQVVCGAPNVREGMFAVWIAPGAVVPASMHEDAPFVIGKRKMRGYESNGMLAGADELDFGDDHSGIVEIDSEMANPGDALAELFELKDLILEIENKSLTHRPDCFGIIGFAREVAGILGQEFEEPDFMVNGGVFPKGFSGSSKNSLRGKDSAMTIEISDEKICQRYSGAVLKVSEATRKEKYLSEMQILISKSGMKPISRIVDVTNYLMLLTGQPLHAFDADKFVTVCGADRAKVGVRLAREGEKLVLLDDSEVELNCDDIVVTSDDVPVALAGAMGGKSTMIDENANKVILESASFSLYNLRKTQMAHGIFTEAITRFTKGTPPMLTFSVLMEAVRMIGGKVLSVGDCFPGRDDLAKVDVSVEAINSLLGTQYSDKLIIKTLENVGFGVKERRGTLTVQVPGWRTDIHIAEDVIEEVGRLLGYDNIQPTLPLHGSATANKAWELKSRLRRLMNKLGANEVLTYSFVSERLMKKVGQSPKNAYRIINSISPDLQFVRQSIVPSLLEKAQINQKIPVERFAIYEMNEVYRKDWGMTDENVPVEGLSFGFVLAERKSSQTTYYKAKKYVEAICRELNVEAEFVPIKKELEEAKPFESKRTAAIMIDGEYAGIVGEFKNSVRSEFKLLPHVAGFEVDMGILMGKESFRNQIDNRKIERRDLTVSTNDSYESLVRKIEKTLVKCKAEATVRPGMIYQPNDSSERKVTVHLDFTVFNEKTMKELEKL